MNKNYPISALLLVLLCIFAGKMEASPLKGSILLTQGEETAKFQPLNLVELILNVTNTGENSSSEGKAYIRYALPQPYEKDKKGILFSTEQVAVPSIAPHEDFKIVFKAKQVLPTISDFVSQEWAARQYQAVFVQSEKEEIIGTLALTYSAYYYPLKINNAL